MRISSDLGRIITELKDQLGSYGRLSIKVGISKAYLVEMSAGKVPGAEYLERVADAYPSRATELFAAAEYTLPDRFRESPAPEERILLKAFRGAKDAATKERILEAIKDIVEAEQRGEEIADSD